MNGDSAEVLNQGQRARCSRLVFLWRSLRNESPQWQVCRNKVLLHRCLFSVWSSCPLWPQIYGLFQPCINDVAKVSHVADFQEESNCNTVRVLLMLISVQCFHCSVLPLTSDCCDLHFFPGRLPPNPVEATSLPGTACCRRARELTCGSSPQPMSNRTECIDTLVSLLLMWGKSEVCGLYFSPQICPVGLSSSCPQSQLVL